MVYSWKEFGYGVDANTVGHIFEDIEKQYGKVTNEYVVQSAASEDSPIHSIFEWDDAVAGHKYRLAQATKLICNLTKEVEGDLEPKKVTVRAYVDVSETSNGKFINVESAFQNADTKEIVLKRAKAELEMFKKKYANLTELADIIAEIDIFVAKIS